MADTLPFEHRYTSGVIARVPEDQPTDEQIGAHETGHRIGAIRNLMWSDVDLGRETIRWRSEHENTGYEHRTPLSVWDGDSV